VKARHLVPLVAIATYFVAGLAWIAGTRGRDEDVFGAGSAFERSPGGASLAFEYLRHRGANVATLSSAIDARVPRSAVVLRLHAHVADVPFWRDGPAPEAVTPPGEHEWLAAGGRLVVALDGRYRELNVVPLSTSPQATKVFPVWPGVQTLAPTTARRLASAGIPEAAATLFTIGRAPAIVRWSVGRGEVVALACPEIFDNAHLAAADHLRLLESVVEGRPVRFDETVHGLEVQRTIGTLLLEWRLGPALLVAGVALVLALWRSRARMGPAEGEGDLGAARSDAVDLVDSIALLYARALGRGELLVLYYEALRRRVALRTGLKGEALDARLQALTEHLPVPRSADEPTRIAFERSLHVMNRAFDKMEDHAHTR
jgi:hypothetical protein